MDKIKIILKTLSPEEQKELNAFVQRQKKKKGRKDIELLSILKESKDYSSAEIIEKLYPQSQNKVAYHALRKRLMRHLTEFIVLKRMEMDPTTSSSIMGMISMGSYLFGKREDRLAWEFLKKAEKLAMDHEQYDLLNTIYNIQIEHTNTEFSCCLQELIGKRNRNKQMADEDERARIANAVITQQLSRVKLEGKDLNFHETTEQVLAKYELEEAIGKRPRLLYNLIFIARSAVLAKKDFYAFEPYIIGMYERMANSEGFSRQHHSYKLKLLYMIAHVLYRNKKFERSVYYLDLMMNAIDQYKRSYFQMFYPQYAMLLAANYLFMDKSEEAVKIMQGLLENPQLRLNIKDQLNALFSLGIYHFLREEFSQTVKCALAMNHSDKWMEKKMGKEWIVKKITCEAIMQYQIGNEDIALQKIQLIEKNYNGLISRPAYRKLPVYLSFLKKLFKNPVSTHSPGFYQEVRQSFDFLPMEQEDLQEVAFYGWLKSQITERPFYEVLLELAHRKGKPQGVIA